MVNGVIISSPLLILTRYVNPLVVWLCGLVLPLYPSLTIPTPVIPEVRFLVTAGIERLARLLLTFHFPAPLA